MVRNDFGDSGGGESLLGRICCHRTLRRGKHRLLLWPDIEADGSVETSTPSKMATQDEMGRLEKVCSLTASDLDQYSTNPTAREEV